MKSKHDISNLVSLLKVFDVNYIDDDELEQLSGLDVNDEADVRKAANALLIPEFSSFSSEVRALIIESLRSRLSDKSEDFFSKLFNRIGLAFDEPLVNKRAFLSTILDEVELANGRVDK